MERLESVLENDVYFAYWFLYSAVNSVKNKTLKRWRNLVGSTASVYLIVLIRVDSELGNGNSDILVSCPCFAGDFLTFNSDKK